MRQLICSEPNKFFLENVPDPTPVEGWVPIDIEAIGICGTDYHIYSGNQPFLAYPRVMGHELSAIVSDEWTGGKGFKAGQRVAMDPYITCGECRACMKGKNNCCENIAVLGVHRDGGMCERIYVPAENLIDAQGLTAKQTAMVEFLAIGCHAVARTCPDKNAQTLVVGGGPIGVAAALFARISGANVKVADVSEERLAMLSELFEFETVQINDDTRKDMIADPFDHVFEATGNIKAMNAGLDYVAHGGTYTLVSVVMDELRFSDPEFHKRETTLYASRNAQKADFQAVISAIKSGQIDTDKLCSQMVSMEDAVEALPNWAKDRNTLIKAIIEVRP